ncbi:MULTISPECIES: hypothetical protein [Photorhabdus]|uniref:Glycoside hydrolase family 42 N-terminal domain-containing protein n=2 Tax=Photorhabdus asymbiotica TaxID=291112 RepID=C7BID9_PHOAA|nr:hypothetical protein [Photorhabdus asymbiotica]RKS66026.1 hypothetical protein BDD30_0303 [Photorhabdus asymbiotica]CAQ84077.1 conserved hypothetical protein [Photorhabdus asymbiotica]
MTLKQFTFATLLFSLLSTPVLAEKPQNFLYTSSDDLNQLRSLLERQDIDGVQIIYNWKQLESAPGKYDFSAIEKDLMLLGKIQKKLFIQIQDRFFEKNARYIPFYLQQDIKYQGGLVPQIDNPGEDKAQGYGWVAIQWNSELRKRYQNLLAALAKEFDGRITGINLPETAIDIDMKHDKTGFSCDHYFAAELDNVKFARQVFKKSYVVQYVNFWPCEWNNDHQYMSRLFDFALKNKIGLGGPDIVPYKPAQMQNAYPFFNRYKGKLDLVAMAVQEPTLTYTNPKTQKPFTQEEFTNFAENYLGANIIFWSTTTPWLKQ